jgi:predicted phosphoribosyltransferase
MFNNREDAALKLAEKLEKYKNTNGVILAIPRGGVPIGFTISKKLNLPLEIIMSKKIGHPLNPEYAIGSVTMHNIIINENNKDVSKEYIQNEHLKILNKLKEKYKIFMGEKNQTNFKNKTLIIVDDGIATGNTILAAIEDIKQNKPKEIIIATPVAPKNVASKLSKLVNEFICLELPIEFMAIGQFYNNFSQVTDEEVVELIKLSKVNKLLST